MSSSTALTADSMPLVPSGDDIEVDRRDDARLQRCTGLELTLLSRPVVVVGACGEPTDSHDDCRRQLRTGS
jgi:hypothetical protein